MHARVFLLSKTDLQLRKKISRHFPNKNLDRCEFTGDDLAYEYMHVIPFEIGSSVLYILLKGVERTANVVWDTFVSCSPLSCPLGSGVLNQPSQSL